MFTGGEPLLHADLPLLMERIKALGYPIKLDTNGTKPERLKQLLDQGLLDRVAMDIKHTPAQYPLAVGLKELDMEAITASKDLLMNGSVEYEFRTTVVKGIHSEADIVDAARLVEGASQYFLQQYVDPGDQGGSGLSAFSAQEMQRFAEAAKPYVKNIGIRGV